MKRAIFYAIMWTIAALPILLVSALLFVSTFAYDILRHPERHEHSFRVWNFIATEVYFLLEANIWQNKIECVEFDEALLYKPSSGCRFVNPEYSTQLTFSNEGRLGDNDRKSPSNHVILLAGDSVTMGWGVNDNETFAHLIASQINVPVFNLGVSSYGTVREIIRTLTHPHFRDANCIVIQYSLNDFDENRTFLTHGALPTPTRATFQQLFEYKPRKASYLDVLITTQKYMWAFTNSLFCRFTRLAKLPRGGSDERGLW